MRLVNLAMFIQRLQRQHTAQNWWKKKPGAFSVILVFFSGIVFQDTNLNRCLVIQKMWRTLALGPALSRHGWYLGSQLSWMILNVQENHEAARIPSNDAHFRQNRNILCCSKVRDVNRSNPLWSFYSDPTGTWLVWDAWTFEVTDSSAEKTYRKQPHFAEVFLVFGHGSISENKTQQNSAWESWKFTQILLVFTDVSQRPKKNRYFCSFKRTVNSAKSDVLSKFIWI